MTAKSRTSSLAVIGSVLFLIALGAIYFFTRNPDSDGTAANKAVLIPSSSPIAGPAPGQAAPALASADSAKSSATVKAALGLTDAAVLRGPIPAQLPQGILCGEVSPSGKPNDFRRFVYNGSAGTGGIDDGTDLFRKFADKICLLQPRR